MRRPVLWPVAVMVWALSLLLAVAGCSPGQAPTPPPAPPGTVVTASPSPAPPSAVSPDRPAAFGYQPLWPFADAASVAAWQQAYRDGGHQPWHLDAAASATAFTTGYLGFGELDQVVGTTVVGREAWVGVGQRLPNGTTSTAAVVHLARWGSGADAPWEVAGTRDTTLAVDTPPYGSTARSPLTVGGTIAGVDESLRLQVRAPASASVLGESCCVPAGGQHARWSATVAYSPTTAGTLAVVVSTGGHVAAVERFAVTAVRPA